MSYWLGMCACAVDVKVRKKQKNTKESKEKKKCAHVIYAKGEIKKVKSYFEHEVLDYYFEKMIQIKYTIFLRPLTCVSYFYCVCLEQQCE